MKRRMIMIQVAITQESMYMFFFFRICALCIMFWIAGKRPSTSPTVPAGRKFEGGGWWCEATSVQNIGAHGNKLRLSHEYKADGAPSRWDPTGNTSRRA